MAGEFDERVVLVTGAGSGIGAATAAAFAREGGQVIALDRSVDGVQQTLAAIRAEGGRAHGAEADVADAASLDAAFADIVARFGRLDAAVNNAGITGPMGLLADLDEAAFDRCLAVNLKGVWLCLRAEIRLMAPRGSGAIVNIASTAGLFGTRRSSPYVASKHGVVGLTRAAALDYAEQGVRVNAVCPGPTGTPQIAPMLQHPSALEATLRAVPLKRIGTPEEIAEAILWLASDRASFATGAVFTIDGGMTAR